MAAEHDGKPNYIVQQMQYAIMGRIACHRERWQHMGLASHETIVYPAHYSIRASDVV